MRSLDGVIVDGQTLAEELIRIDDQFDVAAGCWVAVLTAVGLHLDVTGRFSDWLGVAKKEMDVVINDTSSDRKAAAKSLANAHRAAISAYECLGRDESAAREELRAEAAEQAGRAVEESMSLGSVAGVTYSDVHGQAVQLVKQTRLLRRLGDYEGSERVAGQAGDIRGASYDQAELYVAAERAYCAIVGGVGEIDEVSKSLACADEVGHKRHFTDRVVTLAALAHLRAAQGDFDGAVLSFDEAVEWLEDEDHQGLTPFSSRIRKIALRYQSAVVHWWLWIQSGESRARDRHHLDQAVVNLGEAVRLIEQCPVGWRHPDPEYADPFTAPFADVHRLALDLAVEAEDNELVLELVEARKRSSLSGLIRACRRPRNAGKLLGFDTLVTGDGTIRGDLAVQRLGEIDTLTRVQAVETVTGALSVASDSLDGQFREVFSEMMAPGVIPEWADHQTIVSQLGDQIGITLTTLVEDDDLAEGVTVVVHDGTIDVRPWRIDDSDLMHFWRDPADVLRGLDPDPRQLGKKITQAILPESLANGTILRSTDQPLSIAIAADGRATTLPWAMLEIDGKPLIKNADPRLVPALSFVQTRVSSDQIAEADSGGTPVSAILWQPRDATVKKGAEEVLDDYVGPNGNVCVVERVSDWVETLNDDSQAWDLTYVATHGSAEPGSGLEQTLGPLDGSETITAAEALYVKWPPLVLAAACDVATADIKVGEHAMGFPISTLLGGADNFVGSLHPLSNAAATQVFGDILANLKFGQTASAALANAVREQIDTYQDIKESDELPPLVRWASLICFSST